MQSSLEFHYMLLSYAIVCFNPYLLVFSLSKSFSLWSETVYSPDHACFTVVVWQQSNSTINDIYTTTITQNQTYANM